MQMETGEMMVVISWPIESRILVVAAARSMIWLGVGCLSFLFFTDGLSIYFQSCIPCSIGCCCCIVPGVARYLYAEIAHCWRSRDCIAYVCWS